VLSGLNIKSKTSLKIFEGNDQRYMKLSFNREGVAILLIPQHLNVGKARTILSFLGRSLKLQKKIEGL
jgi:hypothetical protein